MTTQQDANAADAEPKTKEELEEEEEERIAKE